MSRSLAVAALLALAALAGCGGSGAPPPGSPGNPAQGALSPKTDPDGSGRTPARSNEVQQGGRDTGTTVWATGGGVSAPCGLVSRGQVRSIVGEPMLAPREAPQGPTCIYRYASGKGFITLAVQSLDVKALERSMGSKRTDVASKAAYCGNRGQPTLYVPLPSSRALVVAAPCEIAKRIAVPALHVLGA